jgi:hypothetical protein
VCYGCQKYVVHKTASFEAVSVACRVCSKENGILTVTEIVEITHDKDKRDCGKDRGFLEAARIELEE